MSEIDIIVPLFRGVDKCLFERAEKRWGAVDIRVRVDLFPNKAITMSGREYGTRPNGTWNTEYY